MSRSPATDLGTPVGGTTTAGPWIRAAGRLDGWTAWVERPPCSRRPSVPHDLRESLNRMREYLGRDARDPLADAFCRERTHLADLEPRAFRQAGKIQLDGERVTCSLLLRRESHR